MKVNYGDKLQSIAKRVLCDDKLAESIIIKKNNGFIVFNQYVIEEKNNGWAVTAKTIDIKKDFNLVQSAFGWCLAYNRGNYNLSRDIYEYDKKVASKQTDIDNTIYIIKNGNLDIRTREILTCRLSEYIQSQKLFKNQLLKLLKKNKYIQTKGTSK